MTFLTFFSLGCPVCFGDPASPMTQAAKWGVLFLLGVVVLVLTGIASVAAVWAHRARAIDAKLRLPSEVEG